MFVEIQGYRFIMIKVVHISNTDSVGKRFNGMNVKSHCVDSRLLVINKVLNSEKSENICPFPALVRFVRKVIKYIERKLSVQSLLYPFIGCIVFKKIFRKADVVHLHLIHNSFFSLFFLPFLTRKKNCVWTLHDPWALTGHCIHPFDCDKWRTICDNCPYLDTNYPMRRDRTKLMWKIKRFVYRKSQFRIIVASDYMRNMVENSPLTKGVHVDVIPFGIDLNVFRPLLSESIRKKYGISQSDVVIAFRASQSQFKGFDYILKCFQLVEFKKRVVLLALDEKGMCESLKNKYNVIETGWVDDDEKMVEIYNAADIFLMPSARESFGVMAVEAMACGKPVVAFDGSALPEVIDKGDFGCGGIIVEQDDQNKFNKAVQILVENKSLRDEISVQALNIAQEYYSNEVFNSKMYNFYKSLLENRT